MDKLLLEETTAQKLALELNTQDLSALASTCKPYSTALKDEEIWKKKTAHDFGDLFYIYHLFETSTVDVAPDLRKKYSESPSSWRQYYLTKQQRLSQTNQTALESQVQQEVKDTTAALEKCMEEGNSISFNHIASKMLWILDLIPQHGGCYYVLANILFYLQHDQADFVLKEGRRMNPTYQPLIELEFSINNDQWMITRGEEQQQQQQKISQGIQSSAFPFQPPSSQQHQEHQQQDQLSDDQSNLEHLQRRRSSIKLPVLDPDGTALSAPLLHVLDTLFSKFDKDQDQALRHEELDHYVFSTNGQHPSEEFLSAMGQRFGANDKGWLTKEGFLAFYLEQTLGDQDETRKDIAAHGYDRWTFRKL